MESKKIEKHTTVKKQYQKQQRRVIGDDDEGYKLEKKKLSSSYQLQLHHAEATNTQLVPMTSNNEAAELTWENGGAAMEGLVPAKGTWCRASETLESVVHQATRFHRSFNTIQPNLWDETSANFALVPTAAKKRTRRDFHHSSKGKEVQHGDPSYDATFCKDANTTTTITPSSDTYKYTDEDSACHGGSGSQSGEQEMKEEAGRPYLTKRSRTADSHNQSERRRRCRINQKMKTLQRLVPNANKNDKASMLEQVIEYTKTLQRQIEMINSVRNNMPQMMMMQQLQMSLMGMGHHGMPLPPMLDMSRAAITPHALWPLAGLPFFMSPPIIPSPNLHHSADPYCNFLPQTMNMEVYKKMVAGQRHRTNPGD